MISNFANTLVYHEINRLLTIVLTRPHLTSLRFTTLASTIPDTTGPASHDLFYFIDLTRLKLRTRT